MNTVDYNDITKRTWRTLGLIGDSWSDELTDKALVLYSELQNKFNDDEFKEVLSEMKLDEWWNSYLPSSMDEWRNIINNQRIEYVDIEELENVTKFNPDTDYSLLYKVLAKLIKKLDGNIDIELFVEGLSLVTLSAFKGEKPVQKFKIYEHLYNEASFLIEQEILAFIEINKFWEKEEE